MRAESTGSFKDFPIGKWVFVKRTSFDFEEGSMQKILNIALLKRTKHQLDELEMPQRGIHYKGRIVRLYLPYFRLKIDLRRPRLVIIK